MKECSLNKLKWHQNFDCLGFYICLLYETKIVCFEFFHDERRQKLSFMLLLFLFYATINFGIKNAAKSF